MRKWITCTIMAVMMAAMIFMGTGNNVFANDEVTYDSNMQTKKFDVDVKVGEDGSYTVTENIKVKFVNPRHGIYRYIPYKGKVITSDKNGDQKKLLYYADFTLLSNDSKTDVDEDSDGNSQVLRFGSADYTVSKGNYRFTYQLIPKYQGDTYDYLYYNIFPTLWRNKIPEGSTFTIHFPKKTDLKSVNFYYGRYGESKYAKDVITLKYDEEKNRYLLKKAVDDTKDQSYVLYMLTQEQLAHISLPLGGLRKTEVREIAEKHGFVNARKHDSQDICFVPDGDYAKFIEQYTGRKSIPGDFVDTEGNILGKHKGIIHYTIGQRKGLGLSLGYQAFVLEIRPDTNEVVIGTNEDLMTTRVRANKLNFMTVEDLEGEMRVFAKIRYNHKGDWCTVRKTGEDEIECIFETPQRAVTPGQALVLYDGDYVLGGGTILG